MLRPETRGRARALQLLYAAEVSGRTPEAAVPGLAQLTGPEPLVLDFAERLARAVWVDRGALDEMLARATDNWRLDRLALIDHNILRIAAHEISSESVPPLVAIDEAIWLAHRFGTQASAGFVNGVLDRVARILGKL
jgi:N utilization substance protein B